jgi:hypothetical protein
MHRTAPPSVSRTLLTLAAGGVVGVLVFTPSHPVLDQAGLGQRRVWAQPSGTHEAVRTRVMPTRQGRPLSFTSVRKEPTAAQRAARQAMRDRLQAGVAAKVSRLPASDPRVKPVRADLAVPMSSSVRPLNPRPSADQDFVVHQNEALDPAGGGVSSNAVNSQSIAQNGKYVFYTWDEGAARSDDGGVSWTYYDPTQFDPDFCCSQDVIYEKGRDRFFWLQTGDQFFPSPVGGTENRYLLSIDDGTASFQCGYLFSPSNYPLSNVPNTWFGEGRMSLSNDHLYVQYNLYDSTSNALVSHILTRFNLSEIAACGGLNVFVWDVSSVAVDGWRPALVENARETMFMGDQIITNTGLNNGFRIYWLFDDSTSLNFVDKTIIPYLFTAGNGPFQATCLVPGGANPCGRSDSRVRTGTILHNSPLPAGLGAAGDRVDFYWNVREGNGFTAPYIDAAGFHAGTLNYGSRKLLAFTDATAFYPAVAANDRDHVGLAAMMFLGPTSNVNPMILLGVDDNYNSVPPHWEVHIIPGAPGPWTANEAGDYIRVRKHSPNGTNWVAGTYYRLNGQYAPHYLVFGRERDANGYQRFQAQ